MKYLIIFIAFAFMSCQKKSYTCSCKDWNRGGSNEQTRSLSGREDVATVDCMQFESQLSNISDGYRCELKKQ